MRRFSIVKLVVATGLMAALLLAGPSFIARAQRPDLPGACRTDNPFLVTACYNVPMSSAGAPGANAVVAFHQTPNSSPQYTLAYIRDVGSVWGLAYRHADRSIYAAAFHKRYVDFGPGGPGAIYRVPVDLASSGLPRPNVTLAFTVPNAGPRYHADDLPGPDRIARDHAGKTSLGDIDMNPEETDLYVVNLADRKIYRFGLPDGVPLGSFDHGAAEEAWAEDARPFGLKYYEDRLYHGVVNSAESTRERDDLVAYVYSSRPDGSGMRLETFFPLDYPRGVARVIGLVGYKDIEEVAIDWLPWRDGYNHIAAERAGQAVYPQPIVSDIEFADDGDMIIGLKDRQSDMTMAEQIIIDNRIEKPGLGIGDIVPARMTGTAWQVWVEEISHSSPPDPITEFYKDSTSLADEAAVGGLAQLWEDDIVVAVAIALTEGGSRFVMPNGTWYSNPTGNRLGKPENIVCGQVRSPNVPPLEGLLGPQHNEWQPVAEVGDVEVLCGEEPEETATPTGTPSPTPTPTITGTPPPPTPTPTVTPTLPATETPSPTPTPEPFRVFLPITLKYEICVEHADVVLVLDMSSSMERSTGTGRLKYEAALEAASQFARLLDLRGTVPGRHDQLAIVGFNERAWIEIGLSNRRGDLLEALDRMPNQIREGTRLDLALERGQDALQGPGRKTENVPVMVLLTDGIPNRVPFPPGSSQEDTVLQAADRAKSRGTRIFTIGLGRPEDIVEWLLIACANDPPEDHYYYAPDAEDLAEIYGRIARLLPCPGVEPWPPRPDEPVRMPGMEVRR